MRKSKSMRMASGLLVVTMLSTCMISGTFARYTTSDSASDTARVAKWGVTAVVSGDLFGADYVDVAGGDKISATYTGSVDSAKPAGPEKIVAPGTNSDEGVTIKISGTPEVANRVEFESTSDNKDIYLKANESGKQYGIMVAVTGITDDNFVADTYYKFDGNSYTYAAVASEAKYELHDTVTLLDTYYPVKWTVTGAVEGTYSDLATMSAKLDEAFDSDNQSLVEINKTCNIKWAWAIDTNNGADTILGNIIAGDAGAVPVKGSASTGEYTKLTADDYNTTVAFNYKISVTQID